jgi:FixJ family two-component response regulator
MTAADASAVSVVDDNAGVRTAIAALLKSVRLRCPSFAPAKEPSTATHTDTRTRRCE